MNQFISYLCLNCGSTRWLALEKELARQTERFSCMLCSQSAYVRFDEIQSKFVPVKLINPGAVDDPASLKYDDIRRLQ